MYLDMYIVHKTFPAAAKIKGFKAPERYGQYSSIFLYAPAYVSKEDVKGKAIPISYIEETSRPDLASIEQNV